MQYKKGLALLVLLLFTLISEAASPNVQAIRKIIQKSGLHEQDLGMIVQDEQKTLFQMNSEKQYKPASLTKILTGAAALETLGPYYEFRTRLYENGVNSGKSFKGSLYLVGGGDPTFRSSKLKILLSKVPYTAIEGEIVVDDTRFQDYMLTNGETVGDVLKRWPEDTFPVFVRTDPKDTTLAIEKNLRMSLYSREKDLVIYKNMTEPDLWTGRQLILDLQKKGVRVKAKIRRGKAPANARLIAEMKTPVAKMVEYMMKPSNNFIAETLSRSMASHKGKTPATVAAGITSIHELMDRAGVVRGRYFLMSAAGFSHQNLITPLALGKTLQYIRHKIPSMIPTFPIAGVDGTLRNRMRKTPAATRVLGKTGYLENIGSTGVVGLAGYAKRADGRHLTFVFIYNGTRPPRLARTLFDQICVELVK